MKSTKSELVEIIAARRSPGVVAGEASRVASADRGLADGRWRDGKVSAIV